MSNTKHLFLPDGSYVTDDSACSAHDYPEGTFVYYYRFGDLGERAMAIVGKERDRPHNTWINIDPDKAPPHIKTAVLLLA